jgi:hypothetical protein
MLLKCSAEPPTILGNQYVNDVMGSEQIKRITAGELNTSEGALPSLRFYLEDGAEATWLFLDNNDRNNELDRIVELTNSAGAGGGGGEPTPPTGELPKLILPVRRVEKADTLITAADYTLVINNQGGSKQVAATLPKPDNSMNGQIFVIALENDPDGVANDTAYVTADDALISGLSDISLTTSQAAITVQVVGANYVLIHRT